MALLITDPCVCVVQRANFSSLLPGKLDTVAFLTLK